MGCTGSGTPIASSRLTVSTEQVRTRMRGAQNKTSRAATHLWGAVGAAAMGIVFGSAAAHAADAGSSCEVEVRLTAIISVRTLDAVAGGDADAPGEYFVGSLSSAAIGPFDLRTGDSSNFAPGLLLETIDTGRPMPPSGETVVAPVTFGIVVSEDDSNPVGEDDHDDTSMPLLIREHVVCPAGVTNILRTIDVGHDGPDGRRRRSDQLRIGLQIRVVS